MSAHKIGVELAHLIISERENLTDQYSPKDYWNLPLDGNKASFPCVLQLTFSDRFKRSYKNILSYMSQHKLQDTLEQQILWSLSVWHLASLSEDLMWCMQYFGSLLSPVHLQRPLTFSITRACKLAIDTRSSNYTVISFWYKFYSPSDCKYRSF